ncbi:TauD/TfdA family dioxygenase [Streptomyces shenzhenensis]|uniref:TauD/TfdA family dioxygenase n=1 Tax=Streptomyces shenzhenensis TaxID=943815 RepID=UPI0038091DF4
MAAPGALARGAVPGPPTRILDRRFSAQLVTAAQGLLERFGTPDAPGLLKSLRQEADEFPGLFKEALRPEFSDAGMYVLRGLPVEDASLGPTPTGWSVAGDAGALWDVVLLLLAAAMGHPMGWRGQQNGRMVNNIVPAPGHENEQTGASSTVLLAPHTEDAFHPRRADLLLLCCMRNHEGVATTASSVRLTDLSPEDVAALSRPMAPILPDDAYTSSALPDEGHACAGTVSPQPVRTLWPTPDGLTIRFDPAYTRFDGTDPAYRAAYARLEAELSRVVQAVALEQGDVLVVDNDVVVHGRVPFRSRYDGTDRWLKRALVHVPHRRGRPESERAEHGYGQPVIDPYCDGA